ncbi:hypothetical protein KTD31_03395 [Burkholderia multivorans]|uniref:hypothetical protein n=1 Tax=Burkholderia multivorans TaxID=87883 RepID=UPI001C24AC1E|nr:hypothetical protein [Burkholderia multivorans]MBU9200398.1 hypothetical protein [Burkholderia multivorans]MDN8078477.1 hypothetical protein [Burkholderia multivorans]
MPTVTQGLQSVRHFSLPAECSYALDCEVEFGGISPLEAQVLRVDTPAARAFVDASLQEVKSSHWLRNTARQYLQTLSLEENYVWALYGVASLPYALTAIQERMEFAVQCKVQQDLGVRTRAVHFLDELSDNQEKTEVVFSSVHDVNPQTVQAYIEQQYAEALNRLADDADLAAEALAWYHAGNQAQARQIAERLCTPVPVEVQAPRTIQQSAAPMRSLQKKARAAIKKACKLMTQVGAEENVRLLVSGKTVELSHPDSPFRFVLQAHQTRGWLETQTARPGVHVPYQLAVLTKDGTFLSRLCVLFSQTPVLDQLLALTMFVRAGDEAELLEKANWFGIEDNQFVLDYVQQHAPALLETSLKRLSPKAEQVSRGTGEFSSVFLAAHDEETRHWQPFKGPVKTWIQSWMSEVVARVDRLSGVGQLRLA